MSLTVNPEREFEELFGELETLLKNPDVTAALTEKGINASLALLAADGLRAYLAGRKQQAAEDFATVAEEIEARLQGSQAAHHDKKIAPS